MKILTPISASIVFAAFLHGQAPNVVTSCGRLSSLALVNTTITSAQEVPAGKFADVGVFPAPPDSPIGRRISKLPAFCRVAARLAPTPDSDIKIEVWLPASGGNGKLLAVGNGGWAGSINYNGMTAALENGYATTSTDTGHTGGNASFVIGHPEKLVDFAYRAVHEMAVTSKAIMTAYYGEGRGSHTGPAARPADGRG